MTYRGIVNNGVVVLDGEKPAEGTVVEVTPVNQSGNGSQGSEQEAGDIASHPAIGIWKGRKDIPADSGEASKMLRKRLMQRTDE